MFFNLSGMAPIAKSVLANAEVLSGFCDLHILVELGHVWPVGSFNIKADEYTKHHQGKHSLTICPGYMTVSLQLLTISDFRLLCCRVALVAKGCPTRQELYIEIHTAEVATSLPATALLSACRVFITKCRAAGLRCTYDCRANTRDISI